MERYSMSKKERNQEWVFGMLLAGEIKQTEAAELLELTTRQVRRKFKRFITEGVVGLIHRSKNKPGNRKTEQTKIKKILELLTTIYVGFGPTLAAEKLLENHDIKIDHETLRKLMIKNDLHHTKKRKIINRIRREPKHHKGELIQLDGSYHIWFNGQYYTLIAFIDDATKEIFSYFAKESTEGVSKTFKLYIEKYGIPVALYTDRGKVFKVNNAKDHKMHQTQFERITKELDVKIIYARSPQAKGRVERLFRTLQDRLVKELALKKITTVEEANKLLLDYFLDKFNKKFSVPPKSETSFFRPINEEYDLNHIFCYKYKRIINNDFTIRFANRLFQLKSTSNSPIKPNDSVEIFVSFDGTLSIWKSGKKLGAKEIDSKPKLKAVVDEYDDCQAKDRIYRRPKPGSPFNKWVPKDKIKPDKADISTESKRGHF